MGKHSITEDTGEIDRVTVPFRQRGIHRKPVSAKAVMAVSLAAIFLPFGWLLFGFPHLATLWLSWVAKDETENGERDGHSQAVTALILSWVGITFGVITAIAVAFF